MLFMLRDGHRSGALGCRRNIARFISSSIVFGLVRILFIYLGMFIGIPDAASILLSWLVGAYVAWRFVWGNDIWWNSPEQDVDAEIDVE